MPGSNGQEVVALQPTFVLPEKATIEKPAAIELFWLVRKTMVPGDANMELKACSMNGALGIGLPGRSLAVMKNQVGIPVMICSRAIDPGSEFVVFYKETGQNATKGIRTSCRDITGGHVYCCTARLP